MIPQEIPAPFRPDTSNYFTVRNPEGQTTDWGAFYAEINARSEQTRSRVRTMLDIRYGPDPRQFLDVYLPPSDADTAPVLVFVHGGGFREGDRTHYGYIAEPFVASGIVVVFPSYRLLPESTFFDALDDVRSAVAWTVSTIANLGGDPGRVVVSGHSAGGLLAAHVAVDSSWQAARAVPAGAIRTVVPFSAGYDFTSDELPSYARSRLPDAAAKFDASPIHRIRQPVERALVALGDQESAYLSSSRAFAAALSAAGVATELLVLPGHDHAGTVRALGDATTALHRTVMRCLTD